MSTRCPHCGREISTASEVAKTAGGIGVAAVAVGAACFLFGGPIGAAMGGGLAGWFANRAYSATTKAAANAVMYNCPYCGKKINEKPEEPEEPQSNETPPTTTIKAEPKGPMTNEQIQIIEYLRSIGINNPQAHDYFIKHPDKAHDRGWLNWAMKTYPNDNDGVGIFGG